MRDLKANFESKDEERHCVGIVCHTVGRVKSMCIKCKFLGFRTFILKVLYNNPFTKLDMDRS